MTIKLVGLVNGEASEYDGKYLVDYDPTPRYDSEGSFIHLVVSGNVNEARQFSTSGEALNFYMLTSASGPRLDGRADRPLTAYTVEIA
jgi:hypothetical protein